MSNQDVPNLFNVPNPPNSTQLVDKSGNINADWQNYFNNLSLILRKFLSSEGIFLPQQTNDNILLLNTNKSIGALIYNSSTNHIEGNVNGTFQVII